MESSSSNPHEPHVALEVGEEEYPYPSHVCASNLTSVKLSGKAKFVMWKTQTLCLLESHGMSGFIDGTLVSPQTSISGKEKVGDHQTHHKLKQWRRSDALVKSWILSSLSEETLGYVLKRLSEKLHHQERNASDFSAKDVWDELQTIYGPAVLPQLLVSGTTFNLFRYSKSHIHDKKRFYIEFLLRIYDTRWLLIPLHLNPFFLL